MKHAWTRRLSAILYSLLISTSASAWHAGNLQQNTRLYNKKTTFDLMQAYSLALHFDPTYLGKKSYNQSTADNVGIQRADLLPQVSGSAYLQDGYDVMDKNSSYTDGFSLILKQSIFNWKDWKQLSAAKLQKRAAILDSAAQLQDLMQRLAKQYFITSLDQKQVELDHGELENDKEILQYVTLEYKAGKKYKVELYNAKASLASTRARLLADQMTLVSNRNDLSTLIGKPVYHVAELKSIPYFRIKPNKKSFWLHTTLQHNFSILSNRYNVLASKQSISATRGDGLPNLSGSVGYGHDRALTDDGIEPTSKSFTGRLSLSWNMFQSGRNYYQVKQQQNLYAQTLENYSLEVEKFSAQCSTAFTKASNDELQIKLNQEETQLREKAFKQLIQLYESGLVVYTIQNITAAETDYYRSQYSLLQSEYDYLNAIISLREASGTLTYSTLAKINHWLKRAPTVKRL